MKIIISFIKIPELFFASFWWAFVFIIYFSFSWFFNEPLNSLALLMPLFFLLSMYLGYILNGNYRNNRVEGKLNKKFNFTIFCLIGFMPVCLMFLDRGNIGKDLHSIREQNYENLSRAGTVVDTLYQLLFPFTIMSFILVNFNDLKYKIVVNIISILSVVAFIPINGGRVNVLVFGVLYLGIFFYKNFDKITKSIWKSFLKFLGIFLAGSVVMATYTLLRIGADGSDIINSYTGYKFVNKNAMRDVLSIPNGIGFVLVMFIYTFYDYTGGCIYYLSIFLDNTTKINEFTYGLFNFRFLDRANSAEISRSMGTSIDLLYEKYDIKYNVWASAIRDLYADFGFIGTFIFVFVIAYLMFYSKKYMATSYSAQVVFFICFTFFIFSPFHSMFYESQPFGVTLFMSVFLLMFKTKNIKRNKI